MSQVFKDWPLRPISLLSLLLPIAAIHTVVAVVGAPHWDDGLIRLLELEGGPNAVHDAHSEVLLYAVLMKVLLSAGLFWQVSVAMHFVAWTLVGVLTVLLVREVAVEPRTDEAFTAAAIASTGMIGQYYCHLSTIWGTLAVPQLVWVGFLLALASSRGTAPRLAQVAGAGCVAFAMAFSLYSLPVFLAACIFFAMTPHRRLPRARLGVLIAVAAAGIAINFVLIGDGANREAISMTALIASGWDKLLLLPERGLHGLWQVSGGLVLDRVGELRFTGARKAVLAGLALTAWAVWIVRTDTLNAHRSQRPQELRQEPDTSDRTIRLLSAIAALAAGVLPIAFSGRLLESGVFSRYWLPLVPLAAATFVVTLSYLVRPRFRTPVLLVFVFTAGFSFELAMERFIDRDRSLDAATQLIEEELNRAGPEVGSFVAILKQDAQPWPYETASFFELTARLPAANHDRTRQVLVLPGNEATFDSLAVGEVLRVSHRGHVFFEGAAEAFVLIDQEGPQSWRVLNRSERFSQDTASKD